MITPINSQIITTANNANLIWFEHGFCETKVYLRRCETCMAKAAPGAVGFQPPKNGLAPVNQTLFAPTVVRKLNEKNHSSIQNSDLSVKLLNQIQLIDL